MSETERTLTDTRVVVLSIKPSVARWTLWDQMQKTNALLADAVKRNPRWEFVDVGTCLMDPDGKPRAELLAKDGLHLNPEGYALWASVVRPVLDRP